MKLILCSVLFLVAGAVVKAQNDDYSNLDDWFNDEKSFDYANYYDQVAKSSNENTEDKQDDADKLVDAEIQEFRQENEAQNAHESKEFDDYQIEDNRSDSKEKQAVDENEEENIAEPMPDDDPDQNDEDLAVQPLEANEEKVSAENNEAEDEGEAEDEYDFWGDFVEDSVPLPVPEENQKDSEEKPNISSEDSDEFNDQQDKEKDNSVVEENENVLDEQLEESKNQQEQNSETLDKNQETFDEQADIDKVIQETKDILEETNDSFENDDEQDQEKSDEDVFSEIEEEDTPEKVYADLNADLDKLFETLDKLGDNDSSESQESNEEDDDVNEVQDYEDLFGRPFREGNILSMRDDYVNIGDSNLSEIFKEHREEAENIDSSNNNENPEQELFDDAFNEEPENTFDEKAENDSVQVSNEDNQELFDDEKFLDDSDSVDEKAVELEKAIKEIFLEDMKEPLPYGNDGLIDETQPKNEEAEAIESIEDNDEASEKEQTTIMVEDLTSAQFDDLMKQFAVAHSEDLDVHSESFAKHVAPIHVTLSVDEPTVITSPDYPSPYPTNNIIDWIFEGPGTGIELNITDFAVNGALGDYLLVKPGGIDETGTDGLVFSYSLTSERRYRFTNVNRMFVRFESKLGMSFMRGFQFSARMIWPLAQDIDEEVPVPEPVVNPPAETMTVNLAISLDDFVKIKPDFVELLADMATAYIRDNEIDLGLNTTLEVTQITRTAICNIQWPNHRNCVEVTFGVPLHYDNDDEEPRLNSQDLGYMWRDYVEQEVFAVRLNAMGITEFAVPDDSTTLMVWLVIAFGVVISMAMLAFALWRFSCTEDYSRMRAYSDTDSVKNEKRNLDLYPTPHQTLPPLYTENDYKWADDKYDDSTRVDMGGFANKSYVRDELFDLDSDEDVITTRDRNGVTSPRDFYKNV